MPFAVTVGGGVAFPFPAACVWVGCVEACESGEFGSVESPCGVWHGCTVALDINLPFD